MPEKRVKEAIEAIKNGQMVIMMDDEDRENEGDLVYAGVFSTPDKVNFLAREARGLICQSVTKDIADSLNLHPMVQDNSSQHETAFTVSVDATEATTGISAHERDMTIKILANPTASPDELARPGHIFPLTAKDGGVLVRTGHTEGSVDLCKLAGLYPSAVICEIMNEDGTMARRDDLLEFAKKHDMKIIYISDLVEYRLQNEKLIKLEGQEQASFMGYECIKKDISDHYGRIHFVYLFKGDATIPAVKYHTISKDVELFENAKKYDSLRKSVEFLAQEGGALIVMDDSYISDETIKSFGIGAQIQIELGLHEFRFLTSKSNREFVGIGGFGLNIVEEILI
ncbi:MAG: bifunctional 3,4-dihydroxy-2-butanone 4-phosphate synthase/GTP cyclohydrolase II [Campylobacterales bacterium]